MEETKTRNKAENDKTKFGSGLIFAVVLLFVILGMVITLSSVTMLETKMNQKTKSSVGAFYNSESGVEWALNKIANQTGSDTTTISTGFSSTGFNADGSAKCPSGFSADCKIYFLGDDGKVLATSNTIDKIKAVRSVGTQGADTQRAIEAAVASGGGGCYVTYKNDATDAACATGFKNKGAAGKWGACYCFNGGGGAMVAFLRPVGGGCPSPWCNDGGWGDVGTAYVCCQN